MFRVRWQRSVEAVFSNQAPQAMPSPGALSLRRGRNPNPNLKPTWLAIMASRARPDEPEVSRWRAGGGACGEHPGLWRR